jgi:hypothetical protein
MATRADRTQSQIREPTAFPVVVISLPNGAARTACPDIVVREILGVCGAQHVTVAPEHAPSLTAATIAVADAMRALVRISQNGVKK